MPPTVQATVWNWQHETEAETEAKALRRLRRQGLVQALIMGVAGAVLTNWLEHPVAGLIVWILAGCVLILSLATPRAYRPVHQFGQKLGHLVGQLLAYVLLTPLYFLVFVPGALLLRWQSRDPMHRKLRDIKETCWIARHHQPTTASYERQFMIEDKAARGETRPVGLSQPLADSELL